MNDIGFLGLGISVLLHVLFVSITIGAGWISAYSRFLAYLKNEPYLEIFSRKVFKILIVFELFSGVWGTIITVFLAGFFPTLTALATNILFTPLLIALIAIMIRIPSIGIFWYTWGKIHPKYHSMIGLTMAISGFVIPFGFRAIFSEITAPKAIADFITIGSVSPFSAYMSSVFWLLYLHTIFASLSVGGFVVAYLMSLEKDERGFNIGLKYGLTFLLAQIPVGIAYWLNLRNSSTYIFEKITLGEFMPIFVLKITIVLLLLILSIISYTRVNALKAKYLAILALSAVFFGELMNSGARYPYMVVIGKEGIHFTNFANFYIEIPMIAIFIILVFLVISLIVFMIALFYALFKRYLAEFAET